MVWNTNASGYCPILSLTVRYNIEVVDLHPQRKKSLNSVVEPLYLDQVLRVYTLSEVAWNQKWKLSTSTVLWKICIRFSVKRNKKDDIGVSMTWTSVGKTWCLQSLRKLSFLRVCFCKVWAMVVRWFSLLEDLQRRTQYLISSDSYAFVIAGTQFMLALFSSASNYQTWLFGRIIHPRCGHVNYWQICR